MRSIIIVLIMLLPATAFGQQTRQAARPEPPRRRPSMVGYVGDSTIGRQVRIRFDAGSGVDAADRAEFFYAKGGWYRGLATSHNWYDPYAAGPGSVGLPGLNFQQLYVLGEYAVRDRLSVFAEMPLRWVQPQESAAGGGIFDSAGGLSDVRLGVKVGGPGAMSSDARQVTFQFMVTTPTGDSLKGLGTNHVSLEPALLYSERITDRFGVEAQAGGSIPVGGSPGVPASGSKKYSGGVVYYGIGPSYDLYRSDRVRFASIVELVGWHVTGGFQTGPVPSAAGIDIVNVKVGGRVVVGDRSSFYAGYGFAVTDAVWYDDVLRFEYRFAF